ncbi:MAG: FecR domain-containing protein [Acidobacteriia bacterium]|nr:FecR domain-containing protein [Terriglobia bacterium]
MSAENRKPGIHIKWKTVTYRSVALLILAGALIFFVGMRIAFPQFTQTSIQAADNVANKVLERIAGMAPPAGSGISTAQQAHFTALDGTVRVKKGNGNSWVAADYNVPLDKGDVVQTGSEGMAKVVFNDGTSYTVKQDSLIVIEENSANDQQQTNVAVAVSTGTVDLSTATYVQGSKSQVIVAGATASLAPESAAQVHNDPKADQHEILMKKGTGEVSRNGETVQLANWEKVSFQGQQARMEKAKEIGPPTPISPANMAPIFSTGESTKDVEFSWTPMANAVGYRLRISRNPYFSSTLVDKKVNTADVTVTSLGEGAYYWAVQSYDSGGKESVESEKNRFTIIPKGKQTDAINLELDPFIQHGHVIEVTGKTETGARVMVNGREVPMITTDGTFHYFTPPLPTGEAVITITAQTAQGGVNTQQKKIIIQ